MIEQSQQTIKTAVQAASSIGLILTPWWAQLLADISFLASVIATTSGAVIGMVTVWRILKGARDD